MTKPLSYVEAIRDFHPEYNRPPILHYPLRRAVHPAVVHFWERDAEEMLTLAAGLDAMHDAMETSDSVLDTLWDSSDEDDDESWLFETDTVPPVPFYTHFVCSRLEGAETLDAVLAHSLGAAAQANVLAHRLAGQKRADPAQFEEMAEWAIRSQVLVNSAELYRHGLSLVQWKDSRRGQKGAIARHTQTQEIKQRFVEFYQTGNFPSIAEAARRFYRNLSADEQRQLAPTGGPEGAVRTFTAALRKASISSYISQRSTKPWIACKSHL